MLMLNDLTPELIDAIVASSVYRPASVEQEPCTNLTQWQVYEVTQGSVITAHFVGCARYEGRVSSAVQEYDHVTKTGRTSSGRLYKLVGEPGHNKDAMYVFNTWIHRFPIGTPYEEVTDDYNN